MNISQKKLLRYFLNPKSLSSFFSLSSAVPPKTLNPYSPRIHTIVSLNLSTGSPPNFSTAPPFDVGSLSPHSTFRWFSTSLETVISDKNVGRKDRGNAHMSQDKSLNSFMTPIQISQVIEVVRSGEDDFPSKLNLMGLNLSVRAVCEIFQVLNCERVPTLRFFKWVQETAPNLYYNADICSLIIDNCGWLDDYETMTSLLKEFKTKKICLSEKAFGFLPIFDSSKAHVMESIKKMIDILNKVGGSSRGSGICAMIKMFCMMDSFEMAKFVVEITERKLSYYTILIRDRCRRGNFEDARALLGEMRGFGCTPNVMLYNHLLGSLCKSDRISEACSMLEEMIDMNTPPDEITFEIFISHSCRLGKLDSASQFLDRLVTRGLEPRISTHAAFVKGYFNAGQFEEAYKYVNAVGEKHAQSSNMMYSLLASLHQKKGNVVIAHRILSEMMDKGLKPNYPVYKKLVNQLQTSGGRSLSGDLQRRYSRFRVE